MSPNPPFPILLSALIHLTLSNPQLSKTPSKQFPQTSQIINIILGILLLLFVFLIYRLHRNGVIRRLYEKFFEKVEEVEFVNVGSENQNF